MQPKSKAALFDIAHAALGIAQFTEGKTLAEYQSDLMLRSAVERQFGIIGEAMARLRKNDPQTAEQISEHERIVAFRNQLAHGYDQIDDTITWGIIQEKLPVLANEVQDLLTGK